MGEEGKEEKVIEYMCHERRNVWRRRNPPRGAEEGCEGRRKQMITGWNVPKYKETHFFS